MRIVFAMCRCLAMIVQLVYNKGFIQCSPRNCVRLDWMHCKWPFGAVFPSHFEKFIVWDSNLLDLSFWNLEKFKVLIWNLSEMNHEVLELLLLQYLEL